MVVPLKLTVPPPKPRVFSKEIPITAPATPAPTRASEVRETV